MRRLLQPLQFIYRSATSLDYLFFKTFNFLKYRPEAKVISIGNLTTGGTGKTPVLFELCKELSSYNLCVLTRGYRSKYENSFYLLQGNNKQTENITDEALLFNKKFPNIPLLLGKRRHLSARFADNKFQPDYILLDDGFQYRRLHKDINLVLWDSLSTNSDTELIPGGKLREPLERLKDAHAILLTRCESSTAEQQQYWQKILEKFAPGTKIIKIQSFFAGLYDFSNKKLKPENLPADCIAFSAIGKPESFEKQLERAEIKVIKHVRFRDHHCYTNSELQDLLKLKQNHNTALICTEKDRVKITDAMAKELNLMTFAIKTRPISGSTLLEELAPVL
ncbi:MAG: tetraacyldisaccharide 4'-kinase [Candidatus Rifleibacteriota bacterium]